ncbi:hypothetical protein GOZ78_03665 [Agrobacterium vitis]|uniref:BRO-N domain-containing protein n=1 Tax=Agrobacterium vitis TaxID=373 RepID=UPI0009BF2B37|nr:BRO family protein [Agrobacterium vitis]MUO96642.1 hypothetical protein [Agrobacterium vitis]MUZ80747.1 hypothetical protein [Agrobacterium vitis]MVA09117.1 hypothetical protein [Agrobacterium vitis]MVA93173.1 hypothetical protein [Agrobacterium vitis]MVB03980.1 hypothetical protein [Agrobacterium vitis]
MSALQHFNFEGKPFRIIFKDEIPWFVAKDICAIIGLKNHNDAIEPLDDDEKDWVVLNDALGRPRNTRVINESGYSILVLRSRQAMIPGTVFHRFRKMVTNEILPQIRRTGSFSGQPLAPTSPQPNTPAPVDEITRKLAVIQEARMTKGPAYAARLWDTMGMPTPPAQLPAPVYDEQAISCLRHMLRADFQGVKLGQIIRSAFQGERLAVNVLKELRIELKDDGFIVPNIFPPFNALFAGTRWERPFEHLRKLPNAKPHLPWGGRHAKDFTFIPSTYLDEA